MNWINTHGFVLMVASYAVALVISAAPPLPDNCGYFKIWGWNIMQLVGASADKLVKSNPSYKALTQTKQIESPDGTKTSTKTDVLTEVKN